MLKSLQPQQIRRIATLVLATGFALGSLQAALIDNLDGYWRLDETSGNFEDSSGNGNTLTAEGSPWGNGSNGLIDGAMNPNASDETEDYAAGSTGDGAFGDYQLSDAFSAQVWVNLESDPSGFQYYLGRGAGPDFDGGWRISNNGATDDGGATKDSSIARILFVTPDGTWSRNSSLNTLVDEDGWIQLVFTYDGTSHLDGVNLYVNGALDNNATVSPGVAGTSPITGSINEDTAAFSIGNRHGNLTNDVDGDLDEAAVWSRELTAQEVSDLWNEGSGMNIIPEPTSMALLVLGMTALLGRRRRR